MSISLAIFTFVNAWWISMFIALPFGRVEGQQPDVAYKASPARFNWKKSVVIATVLALVITALLAGLINSGILPMDTLS
jgi:predicted secreted protein